jgi:hypothetical protein
MWTSMPRTWWYSQMGTVISVERIKGKSTLRNRIMSTIWCSFPAKTPNVNSQEGTDGTIITGSTGTHTQTYLERRLVNSVVCSPQSIRSTLSTNKPRTCLTKILNCKHPSILYHPFIAYFNSSRHEVGNIFYKGVKFGDVKQLPFFMDPNTPKYPDYVRVESLSHVYLHFPNANDFLLMC